MRMRSACAAERREIHRHAEKKTILADTHHNIVHTGNDSMWIRFHIPKKPCFRAPSRRYRGEPLYPGWYHICQQWQCGPAYHCISARQRLLNTDLASRLILARSQTDLHCSSTERTNYHHHHRYTDRGYPALIPSGGKLYYGSTKVYHV